MVRLSAVLDRHMGALVRLVSASVKHVGALVKLLSALVKLVGALFRLIRPCGPTDRTVALSTQPLPRKSENIACSHKF